MKNKKERNGKEQMKKHRRLKTPTKAVGKVFVVNRFYFFVFVLFTISIVPIFSNVFFFFIASCRVSLS